MNEYIVGLTYADRLQLAANARHQGISQLLNADIAPLTSLMGPMSDGPEWPAGAAWLACRHGANACIVSDGLSDPWVERDKAETGLGLEVFIESPDAGVASDTPLTALADTWLFPLLAEVSHTLAGFPLLCDKLVAGKLLSLEFNIDHIKDGRGRVGALLQQPRQGASALTIPGGQIKLVAATLLTVGELKFLRGKGETGRIELADKLYQTGTGHLSLLQRPSLF
ncbi:MAG: hypothetical protein PHH11_05380 [Methylomonas sp.]|nr:hypothetical protein [Methylomonas sp.]